VISKLALSVVEKVSSTSDLARLAIDDNAASGTVIQAHVQTKGRGRNDRIWYSPKGNLYLSVIITPSQPQQDWPGVSLVVSLALAKTLGGCIEPSQISLKWPNDVLVADQKIAGILLEVYNGAIIIGIGVNLTKTPKAEAQNWPATALSDHTLEPVDSDGFRDQFLSQLKDDLNLWDKEALTPFIKPWTDMAAFLNENIALTLNQDQMIYGRFRGIHANGTMQLETDSEGMLSISAGDVTRARPAERSAELPAEQAKH